MPSSKFLSTASFLLLVVSIVRSQPAEPPVAPGEPKPLPVAPAPREAKSDFAPVLSGLLSYVEDPAFQKELKLTEKQVQQLLALRQKEWDYLYNLPYTEWRWVGKGTEHDKVATAAVKDILTPEQATRAEQLAIPRFNWHPTDALRSYAAIEDEAVDFTRVTVHRLKDYPELAAVLNLSDEQKKLTERDGLDPPLKVLLTAEQSEILRKLFGDTRSKFKPWTATRDPRTSVVLHSPLEIANTYATDLKITPEQATAIEKANPRYRIRYEANVSPAKMAEQDRKEYAEIENKLAKALSAEQMIRLRQITVRLKYDPATNSDIHTPLVVNLANELKVSTDQRKKFDELIAAHAKAIERAALNNDNFYASYHGIRTANSELDKGLTDALTAEQRTTLKELVGEPRPGGLRRPISPVTKEVLQQREDSFGLYTEELNLLNMIWAVQTELKLTADQCDYVKKKAFTKQPGIGSQTKGKKDDNPAETAKSKSNFIAESLATILDAQQAKRFREVMIQYHERPQLYTTSTAYHSGLTYPGVAEELKLTAEQKKRVINGDYAIDVLTEAQWKAFRAMFGDRFTGKFWQRREFDGPFSSSMIRRNGSDPDEKEREQVSFLVVVPWSALNLKPKQQTQLATALNTYQLKALEASENRPRIPRNPLAQGSPWNRDTASDNIIALQSKLRLILVKDLPARVDQLQLQSRAAVNLQNTLELPEVQKALQITPVQMSQLTEFDDNAIELMELVTSSPLAFESRTAILKQLRNQLDMRILAALRPDQLAKWKEMIGEPYDGFKKSEIRRISPRFELHR